MSFESDYGARLRMVIKSEDSGLFEMVIHSKAEAFDPYVFENDSSNKVINCVWFIQTACGLISGLSLKIGIFRV